MTAPELTTPRKPMSRRTVGGAERWSWIFQRVSGVILIVLIFTHLFINLMTGDGVSQIDFAFVAGKWASPLWQWWDYATRPFLRETLHWALRITMIVVIVLGSLVIWTFAPCPVDASGALLEGVPSFCESVV